MMEETRTPRSPEGDVHPPKPAREERRMAPVSKDDEAFDAASFAEQAGLYEESFRDIEENEIVIGTVVAIGPDEVLVDVGYKSEGVINRSEFPPESELAIGDKIDVYLEKKEDQDGVIVLSKEKADATLA